MPRRTAFGLAALTAAALFVHGYHLGVDDAEIYLPAVKKAADPSLYPFGTQFFMSHAHLSLFPDIVGGSARLLHVSADAAIFLWHIAGIFLLLAAAWRLASACFESAHARWGGVALLAATLPVPVAGTALFIADPYVTARTLSTPFTIFAIACYVSKRPKEAAAWLLATALVHPQMSVYGAVFIALLAIARRRASPRAYAVALPFPLLFEPVRGPAREALLARTFFFVSKWAWYEWIGVFAPLALLWFASRRKWNGGLPAFRLLARALVPFGLLFTAAALVLTFPPALENFTRLQPMRAFHLVYVIFFVLLGGVIAEYVLRDRWRRWAALFLPLAAGMGLASYAAFPASAHIEWPGARDPNPWVSAFQWARANTPKDAVFALDPDYMAHSDQHGFRAVADRSALADALKDSGAVSLFPGLAEEWKREVQAQSGLSGFKPRDFEALAGKYPVSWAIVRGPVPAGLGCPYQNAEVAVCRIASR